MPSEKAFRYRDEHSVHFPSTLPFREGRSLLRGGFRRPPREIIGVKLVMQPTECITTNPRVMGGKPCIRGMRVTVGTVVGLVAAGCSPEEILTAYPYLEAEDIPAALAYAAKPGHSF